MSLEVEKESIELKVSLKTWLQLILTLVISGFLLFLVLSFIGARALCCENPRSYGYPAEDPVVHICFTCGSWNWKNY